MARDPLRTADPFTVSFRMSTLRTGIWPTIFVCGYATTYLLATMERANRPLMLAIIATALLSSVVIGRLPMERVVRGRWCEPFFLAWSASLIVFITACSWLDGGVGGPLSILYFLPLVYAALSYPLPSMLLVGAFDLAAFLLLASLGPAAASDHVFLFAGALANAAWICAWQTRNHDAHRRELARASLTDPLTGCLNRRGFEERFAQQVARARRDDAELTLIVLDLDGFKGVNDRYGHAAGDDLLRWVAERLRADVRADDVVARLGGDEFALLAGGPGMSQVADRVRESLAERISVSVGAACFPGDGEDLGGLHLIADAALYESKRARWRQVTESVVRSLTAKDSRPIVRSGSK